MIISKKTLLCIFLMLSSQVALSDEQVALSDDFNNSFAHPSIGIKAHLATIDNIYDINLNDSVKSNCLPYPNKLKDAAEIGLRRNGFGVDKNGKWYDLNQARILINITGQKHPLGGGCYGYIEITLEMLRKTVVAFANEKANEWTDGKQTYVDLAYRVESFAIVSSSERFQSQLETITKEAIDTLYLDVSRAREDIFKKFPSIKKNYEAFKQPEPMESVK